MKYTFLKRTAREMHIWHWPDQGIAFVCIVLIITLLGPFETYSMPVASRFLYWILSLAAGWSMVILAMTLVLRHPGLDDWWGGYRVALAVIIAIVPLTLAVIGIENWLRPSRDNVTIARFFLNTTLISGLIAGTMYLRVQARLGRINTTGPSPAPFLRRLPYALGTELISFSMQDHYIEVTTTKGTTLILMSLGDALEELGNYEGIQIHRSHWIATSAFRGLVRQDGKQYAKLSDGREVPVSRTYSASARALSIAGI